MLTSDILSQRCHAALMQNQQLKGDAYLALSTLLYAASQMYPGGKCAVMAMDVATRWSAYMEANKVTDNELGQIYREIASTYNTFADNLRDESHETTVDR